MTEFRSIRLGLRGDVVERAPDGSIILRSPEPLGAYCRSATDRLAHWADVAPERTFLGERDALGDWRRISYGDAFATVCRLAQGLLDRGLTTETPLMVLSGNDIEHALIGLAAMHVGIPYVPVSVPYSLAAKDHEKLRHIAGLVRPGALYVASGLAFDAAIAAIEETLGKDTPPQGSGLFGGVIVGRDAVPGRPATLFDALAATPVRQDVAAAAAAVTGETVAKILFTSGSTAMPKGVINPHRMMCANQQMASQAWPFLQDTPPVVVDWLPWNHTFGGNFVFGNTLFHGGTLYIDDGRPVGDDIKKSVRNLADIQPTVHFNVPKGFEMLLPYLAADRRFAERFFARIQMFFYAAAALPQPAWDALQRLAIETCGERIFITSSLGSTETGPLAITANWLGDLPGNLGLAVPGVEIKLVPFGQKLAMKIRSPSVTPGYWGQPEKTKEAFDAEGWYAIGDAVKFVDPADPAQGLLFDGRLAEDFKLSSGVWVSVGELRDRVSSQFFPWVRDFVICGPNRDDVGVLVFPNFDACRSLGGLGAEASYAEIIENSAVHATFQRLLDAVAALGSSSSTRIVRAFLIADEPHAVEMTDKRTLAANLIIERRTAEIDELYGSPGSPRVLLAKAPPRC